MFSSFESSPARPPVHSRQCSGHCSGGGASAVWIGRRRILTNYINDFPRCAAFNIQSDYLPWRWLLSSCKMLSYGATLKNTSAVRST
mmetsp:Transcript_40943/g.99242  ORF Transcript_40943/g.99242 Transcript_40943/m.99242 type:complete len:87 (-) Transcript_40943:225-485(-)